MESRDQKCWKWPYICDSTLLIRFDNSFVFGYLGLLRGVGEDTLDDQTLVRDTQIDAIEVAEDAAPPFLLPSDCSFSSSQPTQKHRT
jgi:hypothetical protein